MEEPQKPRDKYREVISLTEPKKLRDLTLPELEDYYDQLHSLRWTLYGTVEQESCDARKDLLRREIELRRVLEHSDKQHGRSMGLGRLTAVLSGLALVVGIVFGVIQCRASKHFAMPPQLPANSAPSTTPAPTIEPSSTIEPTTPAIVPELSSTPQPSQSPTLRPEP